MRRFSIKELKSVSLRLLKSNHSPREIASGVAIGAFIAILPLYGFHTLLCILAFLLIPKVNKLAILLGTNVSLPPTVTTITWTSYDIGRMVLAHNNYPPLSWDYFTKLKLETIHRFYFPLFVGSIILGLLCAVIFYYITLFIARKVAKKAASDGTPL